MEAMVYRAVEISIKPGDTVEINYPYKTRKFRKRVQIRRLVETEAGVYVVFSNNTWRPLSSYGATWVKVLE